VSFLCASNLEAGVFIDALQTQVKYVILTLVTDSNGLVYMRARYYSPDMRRFVNADIVAGKLSNAITLNRFAYANGNPVSFVDPFGLSAERSGGILSQATTVWRYEGKCSQNDLRLQIVFDLLESDINNNNGSASKATKTILDWLFQYKHMFGIECSTSISVPVGLSTTMTYTNQVELGCNNINAEEILIYQLELLDSIIIENDACSLEIDRNGFVQIKYAANIDDRTSLEFSVGVNMDMSISATYSVQTTVGRNGCVTTDIGFNYKQQNKLPDNANSAAKSLSSTNDMLLLVPKEITSQDKYVTGASASLYNGGYSMSNYVYNYQTIAGEDMSAFGNSPTQSAKILDFGTTDVFSTQYEKHRLVA